MVRQAGAGDDERTADAVLILVLFAEKTVAAERKPLVAGEDDDGVVDGRQCGEDTAELRVDIGDHRVIEGDLLTH